MRTFFYVLSLVLAVTASASDWKDYYVVEKIPIPEGVDRQIGGVTVLRDGCIAACFHRGEVLIYTPRTKSWSRFAEGLQNPLGIVENEDGSLTVMQWAELTRLVDTDQDGEADHYETLFDGFGVSGNYHEFAFGPAKDSKGNLYVALNVGSNFAGVNEPLRGPFSDIGFLDREGMVNWREVDWPKVKGKAGRMFSRVAYRGWVMKIAPDGTVTPFACGFRSPDGIGVDRHDRVWVTDNQGDWRGTSPVYLVEEGKFYGHPASLVWQKDWDGRNPLEISVEELDKMRTPAAALLPQGELANSPTEPIVVQENFGIPAGELLIGEMNQPTLIRYLEDEVGGVVQGTVIPFLNRSALGMGNHRFSFDAQGAMYVGKIHLGWAGDEGFLRVKWTGKPMLLVDQVKLTKEGFEIHFNEALQKKPWLTVKRHTYHYHAAYGSPKVDEMDVAVLDAELSEDGQTLILKLSDLVERQLYTIRLNDTVGQSGNALMGDVLRYNLVNLRN